MIGKFIAYIKATERENIEVQVKYIKKFCMDNNISLRDEFILIDKYVDDKQIKMDSPQALRNLSFRPGDTLIIKELGHLGKDLENIKRVWQSLYVHGIDLIIINNEIFNTFNKSYLEKKLKSDVIYELLNYLSDKKSFSRNGNKKHNNSRPIGRPKENLDTLSSKQLQILELNFDKFDRDRNERTITADEFMKLLGLKRNTFYKIIKQYKKEYINKRM